jgi:hypothetical protein
MPQRVDREAQISVPVDRQLRAAIERVAEAEHRTVAGQIRHWIATGLAAEVPVQGQL